MTGLDTHHCHPHCLLWWAGKDSNLGSRWQQIYSLPPLATWVPARILQQKNSTYEGAPSFASVRDGKRRAGWSTHSTPVLKIKDESDELRIQPCLGNG